MTQASFFHEPRATAYVKLSDVGDVSSTRFDGSPSMVVTHGTARGESGVAVVHLRYRGGCHVEADLRQHVVCFASAAPIMRRALLSIFPAGIDTGSEGDCDVRSLLMAIDTESLAFAPRKTAQPGHNSSNGLTGVTKA